MSAKSLVCVEESLTATSACLLSILIEDREPLVCDPGAICRGRNVKEGRGRRRDGERGWKNQTLATKQNSLYLDHLISGCFQVRYDAVRPSHVSLRRKDNAQV